MRLVGPLTRELAQMDAPSLEAAQRAARDAVDRGYWAFSRQARGQLPSPQAYSRRAWIDEAVTRSRAREVRS